jgi:DNA sulfur modification protein DndD
MRLEKIELKDFRQFKGQQTLLIANEKNKNVTVVYGKNGRGKTGIFRALMFCLYGDRSLSQDELIGQEKKNGLNLINDRTLKDNVGHEVTASVSVRFSHQGKQCTVSRELTGLMKDDGMIVQNPSAQDQVALQVTGIDGNTSPKENDPDKVRAFIQEMLSSRLRDYFLFDGERIERLTRGTAERRDEVRKGIRALLDLDAMELAIKGLKKLASGYDKEISQKSTGRLQKITEQIAQHNEEIEAFEETLKQDNAELKCIKHRIVELSKEIEGHEATAEKERLRKDLISQVKDKQDALAVLKSDMTDRLNHSSHLLAADLLEQLLEELNLRRDKGQLPPEIRKEFVEKLLSDEACICGTPLDDTHSRERDCLQKFLAEHYSPGLGQETLTLYSALNKLSGAHQGLADSFNKLLLNEKRRREEIEGLERKIQQLNEELGQGGSSAETLVAERTACENDKETLILKIDRTERDRKRAERECHELRKEAGKLATHEERIKQLQDKRNLTEDTRQELKRIYDTFARQIKSELAAKSTEIFQQLADEGTKQEIKTINIDDNYMLDVLNYDGQGRLGEISAGQRQIVSLAFIMALIQVAGNLEVPLFMDTPFGRLSGEHRDHLLAIIPKIASQWILLATDTEFTRVEAEALRQTKAWGKVFVLAKKEEGTTEILERDVTSFTPTRATK